MAAKNETSQSHNTDRFPQLPGMDAWMKATGEYAERLEGLYQDLARVQDQATERSRQVIDEAARLMKDSVDYAARLHGEWRKAAVETTKRFTGIVRG